MASIDALQRAVPIDPPKAVVLAEAHRGRGVRGVYRMRVAQAERTPDAVYLNSSVDYRAPDDLTFQLRPSAARRLERTYHHPAETLLLGKTVRARGEIRLVPVHEKQAGGRRFVRYQHTVLVRNGDDVDIEITPLVTPAELPRGVVQRRP